MAETKAKAGKHVKVTMEELGTHSTKSSMWYCIHGKVYDLTKWAAHHPGGEKILTMLAGKDVTDPFVNFHPDEVTVSIKKFCIGEVTDYKVSAFVQEHRDLRAQLVAEGLFETDMAWYVRKFILNHLWVAASIALPFMGYSGAWPYYLSAVLMGCFFQQVAFFGHDICHNAITHDRNKDYTFAATIGVLGGGISVSWWKATHNVHHIVTNSAEYDPDIQHLPVFAVDDKLVGTFWSAYHNRYFVYDTIAKFLVSIQHYLYYPVMAVARFNLILQSYIYMFKNPGLPNRNREVVFMMLHLGWLSLFLSTFPTGMLRFQFVLISFAVSGLLHVQITLSHFTMPVYNGLSYNTDKDEYWHTQLGGSLNVDCYPWMDWFHGGLQFQIEHHLFPRMPRHNLRTVQPRVQALCKKHGITYRNLSFYEANLEVIDTLKKSAMLARKTPAHSVRANPIFEHGLNAVG